MFIGPVFTREAITTPRRVQHYLFRGVYVLTLLVLMGTAWLVVAGTQVIRNVGDMARFGGLLFQLMAPFQLLLLIFMASLSAAMAVSQEKDRRTLLLLLMSRLSNSELVVGKLLASLLNVATMLLAALPVFWMMTLFGGVSGGQVTGVFAISLAATLTAGSLGATLALWREKTFQALAMTILGVVLWLGVGKALDAGLAGDSLLGVNCQEWAAAVSPWHAVNHVTNPSNASAWSFQSAPGSFLMVSLALTIILTATSVSLVRVWNPSRAIRRGASTQTWDTSHSDEETAKAAREASSSRAVSSRNVWDNPVLWREICTWAYGRKVLVIKFGYILVGAAAAFAVHGAMTAQVGAEAISSAAKLVPVATVPLALFFLISLVLVNALAVTSITNERDGQALDLLLVTDLTPREFVFGKLLGVLWVSREMVVLPVGLCVYVWWMDGMTTENLVFVLLGLAVMYAFAATLGVHCGMTYANSRTAIGVSLGVLFFLFLGIGICMLIMISFSGSFQTQLAPFVAFILGGGVGLLISLGHRNPSRAILMASFGLPFATFYAITSFVLGNRELWVFLVLAVAYGFTTAAMLVPAIGEFDIAMGRTKTAEED